MSRNLATIQVAEPIGFDQSPRCGGASASARRRAYPSIALGVFELTPLEVAQAYTLFPNGGEVRPLTPHHAHRETAGARCCRSRRCRNASAHPARRFWSPT